MSILNLVDYIADNLDRVGSSWSCADDRLANLGGNPGDVFVRAKGNEYNGLAVRLLDRVYPLYTVQTVSTIVRLVKNNEYMKVLDMMGLQSVEELEYVLYTWTVTAIGTSPVGMSKPKVVDRADILNSRVSKIRHDPIDCRLEVTDVGYNSITKSSAVPEDWMGRIFDSGEEMHRAMDEFRPGKPPTTYAVIYSMTKREQSELLDTVPNSDSILVWLIDSNCRVHDYDRTALPQSSEYSYIRLSDDEYVGFVLNEHFTERSTAPTNRQYITEYGEQIQTLSSGVLSSMLQKAVRRGCADLVAEVLLILNEKPNYNLPDMGFTRVSSSRQCTWRLYISALEDVTYYTCTDGDDSAISLLGLVLLSLVSQRLLDYRYSDNTMKLVCSTARRLCNTTVHTPFNSINGTVSTEDPALSLALDYMPMMASDKKMLEKYLLLDENKYTTLSTDLQNRVGTDILLDTILSSFDHHCRPDIILVYQSLLPTVLTTRDASKYIWDHSSAINYRKKEQPDLTNSNVTLLRDIQDMLYWQGMPNSKEEQHTYNAISTRELPLSDADKREVFLVLFGKPYRHKGIEYMIAGTDSAPIKYKIKGSSKDTNTWIHTTDTSVLQYFPKSTVTVKGLRTPLGYEWISDTMTVEYTTGKFIVSLSDRSTITVPLFDGSVVLRAVAPVIDKEQGHDSNALQLVGHTVDDILEYRLSTNDKLQYLYPHNWSTELVILTYTKLFNRIGSEPVSIGPIDRKGNRTEKSINLEYEGRLWYIFSYLSWLYPNAVRMAGTLKFTVNTSSPEYVLLIEGLREMLYYNDVDTDEEQTVTPTITTELWTHQQSSVDTMYNKLYKGGVHGMGDASDVGAGKTLTALALGSRLIGTKEIQGYRGILVLVPNKSLIESWKNEIQKHTEGYEVLVHTAKSKIRDKSMIKRNTVVLSALNTMRDHPVQNPWILTVIDECLSVQNSSAQWTEEAWKQSLISRHVVLLSATFFRSRYNKLYYMLSMLQSVLPNSIEYLPTILSERIVVHKELSTGRDWITNTTYVPFPEDIREQYDSVQYDSSKGDQEKYGLLQQLLNSKRQYVAGYLRTEILEKLSDDRRVVIYTSGNDEAKLFSAVLGIPIYGSKGTDPKNCRHIIATLSKAAVGVNDLVHFNTVLMRPPPPDLLPQIKGRLDRPGQQNSKLYLEYFMIDQSIDLGLEVRMNIASNFLSTYIMPLAEFYTTSIRASSGQ